MNQSSFEVRKVGDEKMKKLLILAALGFTTVAAAAPADAQVNRRQDNQQQRIDRGVRSGQITGREADRLQRNQNNIARAEDRMRSSGGRLTNRERARLDNRQDRAGSKIRRQRNDRQRYGRQYRR
ncbi:hypothetical protein [Sphingomonas prati]|uniref:Uncharacterized protein n=1 Tax=Sphingomonas prati TaxID=1843237 RepID=A0A7W9BW90_9SPHN|nr:hypothetical protein [Sphingomonas prati]MBB5730808.1 hypothetical protein [Sphingomonas prati]GGE96893.1 hypothetical protein GCM10011404_32560 [Sphingomonas prati]